MALTAINYSKLLAVGAPGDVVDRSFLIQSDTAVEISGCTEQVHRRFAIVTHVGVVDFSLSEDQRLRAEIIPLDLRAISLVKGLRASWGTIERKKTIDLDARRGTLSITD